jgi:transcriptional antiterminator NusG
MEEEKKEKDGENMPAGRRWYAIHTYSGYEDAVARYLKQRVDSLDMSDKIFNVIVPKEKKIKIKSGRRQTIEEKVYPGYVMVEMILTEDSWYVVRNTPHVTGFIGADSTMPSPLKEKEVDELLGKMKPEDPEYLIDLEIGDIVRITDGPFKDSEGKVSEMDKTNSKVKVMITVFGRETPVELDFLQVKKI